MEQAKTYTGGCHCGQVRYQVEADLGQVMECNCSICTKRGSILTFTAPDKFNLTRGEDRLTDYQFNNKVIHHLFCPTCGIGSFARGTAPDGKAMVAINVRCLNGVDISALKPMPFDGKSL